MVEQNFGWALLQCLGRCAADKGFMAMVGQGCQAGDVPGAVFADANSAGVPKVAPGVNVVLVNWFTSVI